MVKPYLLWKHITNCRKDESKLEPICFCHFEIYDESILTKYEIKPLPEMGRAVIEVFGGCNFKCDMCPQTVGRGKDWTRKMPLDLFENILKQQRKTSYQPRRFGEPTMAKDLYKYVQLCTDYGFDSFIYNGSKLTGDLCKNAYSLDLNLFVTVVLVTIMIHIAIG